jgi:hypothetical protein
VLALFCGEQKPSTGLLLGTLLEELRPLVVSGAARPCLLVLRCLAAGVREAPVPAIIALPIDKPMQAWVTCMQGHNATQSCLRCFGAFPVLPHGLTGVWRCGREIRSDIGPA